MHSTPFLTRYSALMLGVLSLSACSYILPDDASVARYNRVIGERHTPQLNPGGGGEQTALAPVSAPAAPAPERAAQADAPNFPPVDEATRTRAAQEMATTEPVAQTDLPPAMIAPMESNGRHIPVENVNEPGAAPMQMSANDYPPLSSVPPRPPLTGDTATGTHLSHVRTTLEQDRLDAQTAKDQLSHDATAEPSMLPAANLPEATGTVPPPAPVSVIPVAPPPSSAVIPQSSITAAPPVNTAVIGVPPAPIFAPPPPMDMAQTPSMPPEPAMPPRISAPVAVAQMPVAQASSAVTYTPPAARNALPPIILHPPGEDAAAAPVPAPAFTPARVAWAEPQPMSPAANNGFDPMSTSAATTANNQTVYAPVGYLPSSRYTYDR